MSSLSVDRTAEPSAARTPSWRNGSGVPVQITAVTPQEWDKPTSRFLLEVQHRPHLTVLIGDELINILTPVVDKILSTPR
jgi:hypothetical protein